MASSVRQTFRTATTFKDRMKKWVYNASGFNRYGLHHDDVLDETADIKEALRRLPEHVVDERNFRLIRAMQLDLTKTILPKNEWVQWEEDNRYLEPYLKQVIKEREEREDWNKK